MDNNAGFVAGFDEFGCFHLSDFQIGDAIIVKTKEGKVRGLVSRVNRKNASIFYRTLKGNSDCNINDICFLSDSERGWLNGK